MAQSRFWIASYPNYQDAHDAKEGLKILNEDKVYQIRLGKDKSKIVFRVVERLQGKEAKVINDTRNIQPKRKGAGKRRRARILSNPVL